MLKPKPEGGDHVWGAEKSFLEIARSFREQGVEISTVEWPPAMCRSRAVPFRTFELVSSSGGFSMLRAILATISICRITRSQAIYAYTLYFRETVIPALVAAIVLRKPLYVSVNDDKRREEDESSLSTTLRQMVISSRSIRSIMYQMAYHLSRRFICRVAKASFVTTGYVADFARSVLKGRRVIVVERGIGSAWIQGTNPGVQGFEKIYDAAYLGRLDQLKGIGTLLLAWKLVVDQRSDAKLLVMGSGDLLEGAIAQAKDLGMAGNVVFTGYVADESVIQKSLRSARIFVFPSLKEGFANAVAQAMACSLPCVISDIPEMRSFYGPYAVLATPDSPVSFSRAILRLLDDAKLREFYGSKGQEFARTLKWSAVATRMLSAMKSDMGS